MNISLEFQKILESREKKKKTNFVNCTTALYVECLNVAFIKRKKKKSSIKSGGKFADFVHY